MDNFVIVTDSSADLPVSYLEEHGILTMSLTYNIEGETYLSEDAEAAKSFYTKVRNGSLPTTSQVNPQGAKETIIKALEITNNVLCISFSSGLSGTYNSTRIAASEILESREHVNIIVVDSLCASMGEGLLVHKAVCLKEAGKSMEEVALWLEENKKHLVHMFTVDDLNHLYRGGRVNKTAAVVGTLINLKPVLHVDDEGHLVNVKNVRGRKKALHALVDFMGEKMGSYREQNDIIFISHGDSLDDAKEVAALIEERYGISNVMFNQIGPSIGAHSGPDTIALFFMGEER